MSAFRSVNVTSGTFDPTRMDGIWYEAAYQDPAQIGSRCQTLNSSFDKENGVITIPFSVDYGPIPFSIVEVYQPTSVVGLYGKSAVPPFSKPGSAATLTLPTVFVDVTAPSPSSPYDTMTLYSCLEVDGHAVTELIFATRDKDVSDDSLAAMEAAAKAQGLDWEDGNLNRVNYDGCDVSMPKLAGQSSNLRGTTEKVSM
jgi:hypothetical protein